MGGLWNMNNTEAIREGKWMAQMFLVRGEVGSGLGDGRWIANSMHVSWG